MSNGEGPLKPGEIPDWRLHLAARVAEAKSGRREGSAQPGDILTLMGQTKTRRDGKILIPIPGPYRLALNAAISSAREAQGARGRVKFIRPSDPSAVRTLDFTTIGHLFDYLERAMVCTTLSFQAIEAYVNVSIGELLDEDDIDVEYRGERRSLTADEIERRLSTEQKVGDVLPRLRGVKSPKGTKVWQRFKRLKSVRDSGVHLKLKDFRAIGVLDKDSLLAQLLDTDPRTLARTPIKVMRYFTGDADVTWLDHAEELLQEGEA